MNFDVYALPLREIMDAAMYGPLPRDQIDKLPLHTRCRLIRRMTLRLLEKNHIDWNNMANDSLLSMGKSFEISEAYVDWHDKRKTLLFKKLKEKQFRPVLNAIRHWDHASDQQRKDALRTTVSTQQRVFMEGTAAPLPISHQFVEFKPRRTKDGVAVLFGTFTGDMNRGSGRIRQSMHAMAKFDDALTALDTGHHEMDHGIHFSLAYEYHHGRIRPDHPLYADARYFHAVEVHDAGIPPSLSEPYSAQTFEVLAGRDGTAIATGIYALAL
jgi:hypothetical protein